MRLLWILLIVIGFGTLELVFLEGRTIFSIGIEGMEWSIDFLPNIFIVSFLIDAILYLLLPRIEIGELSIELAKWGLGITVDIERISFGFLVAGLFHFPYSFLQIPKFILGFLPGLNWPIIPGILKVGIGWDDIPWGLMVLAKPLYIIPSLFAFWRGLYFDAYIGLPLEENHLYFGVDRLILSNIVCLGISIIKMLLSFIQLGLLLAAVLALLLSLIPNLTAIAFPVALVLLVSKFLIGLVQTLLWITSTAIWLISLLINIYIRLWFNIDAEGLSFGADPSLLLLFGIFLLNPIPALGIDIEWPW